MQFAPREARPVLRAILASGIITATIDIGMACLINGRSVTFILHAIAGGFFAERSYSGGAYAAATGLRSL